MNVLYIILVGIVILFFGIVFRKMVRSQEIVTPLMGWIVGLAFFLILPLAILALNSGYKLPPSYGVLGRWGNVDFSDPAYLAPFMVIWTSLMLTASVVYVVVPRYQSRSIAYSRDWQLSVRRLRTVILVCAVLALGDWAIRITAAGGVQNYFLLHWYTRDDDFIKRLGSLFVLYQHITVAVQVVLTAAVALLATAIVKQRGDRRYGLLFLALSMLALNMIMTGNRIFIALFMLYCLTMLMVHRRFRLIFLAILFIPVFTFFFSAWARVRGGLGDPAAAIANYQNSRSENNGVSAIIDVTEGTNVMLLLHIIRDFGSRYDLLFGETYAKVITFIIPRRLYPDKIENFTVIAARLYEPGAETSLNSTALGEMYANFGLFAVLMLPICTLMIHWISRRITRQLHRHALLSAVLFLIFAWIARSTFSNNFLYIVFAAIIITGLRFEKGILHPANIGQLLRPSLR